MVEQQEPELTPAEQQHKLLAYFCGLQLYGELRKLARGRGEDTVEMALNGIDRAIVLGGFEIDREPDDRRTGFDEQRAIPVQRRMIELLGDERYSAVVDRARDRNVSNTTMLRLGLWAALERGML